MKLAKEGLNIISVSAVCIALLAVGAVAARSAGFINALLLAIILFLLLGTFCAILLFFREPLGRSAAPQTPDNTVLSSVDGTVVAIEEVFDSEFFNDNCLQLSVFMSLTNIHANWYPISGTVVYSNNHPGKFLVAWHPKSSELNERTTTVVDTGYEQIMFRQIAGLIARRIVNYAKPGDAAVRSQKYGFIKFGSRIDLFLPLDAQVLVSLGDKVRGGVTPVARLNR